MSKVMNALNCKCPECKKGNIFKSNGKLPAFKVPKMNERCPNCNYKFEKETGFFFGAMYVSYSLTSAVMIASFVLFWVLLDMSPLHVFILIVLIAIATSTLNFRLSRSIWIYLFYKNPKKELS